MLWPFPLAAPLIVVQALLTLAEGVPAPRQLADPGRLGPSAERTDAPPPDDERFPGTYRFEDGRLLIVWDLRDQMPENRSQLVATEPRSGWIRTLRPDTSGTSDAAAAFVTGSGFFVRDSVESRLVFGGSREVATTLRWTRAGNTLTAERVPLRRRQVEVPSGDVLLAGELVLPPEGTGAAPYPALVMIHGSGPLTRRTPRYVADQFALAGVAVVIYDKRGTGASGGDYTQVPGELARDAAAVLEATRRRPEVDGDRVGVMGGSEGGLIVAEMHAAGAEFDFLVCRVCPTVPLWETRIVAAAAQFQEAGLSVQETLGFQARQALIGRYVLGGQDWEALRIVEESTRGADFRTRRGLPEPDDPPTPQAGIWDGYRVVMSTDPTAMYRELDVPVLALLGEYDVRVPGGYHAFRLRLTLERAGHTDHEIRVLPRASHGLMVTRFGVDGGRLPFRRFVPGFHEEMVEWVVEHVEAMEAEGREGPERGRHRDVIGERRGRARPGGRASSTGRHPPKDSRPRR